jgi:DNA-binding transcriptional ArsR family regulator
MFANICLWFYARLVEATSITPDLSGLRALSHPVRMRMLGLLRLEGPATATTLAARLGLNTGATSYHLRQLAEHGFVVDDPARGNGRDRWWAAAHRATETDPANAASSEEQDTHDAYLHAVAIMYTEQLQRAVEERRQLPHSWQEAGTFSDWQLTLTPERARALTQQVTALIQEYVEDADDADGTAPFVMQVSSFVRPGAVATNGAEATS